MLRSLRPADTVSALRLLRERPIHIVFLEHVVRSGALGLVPGFSGWFDGEDLEGLVLVAPGGATLMAARAPDSLAPLADAAWNASPRPRHILGPEDTTVPFWDRLRSYGPEVRWERREPVYVLGREDLPSDIASDVSAHVEPAKFSDLDCVVENSAEQYSEDLKEDRRSEDPLGFRERHEREIREGRWWVLRVGGRVVFQVHVGAENADAVQIGGVFTPEALRGKGHATRGLTELSRRLLERRPNVALFCDEDNAPARRVYERLGFSVAFHQRSWLLAPDTASLYV